MGRSSNPVIFLALISSLVLFSCASTRYQEGFSYQPAYSGPDVSTGISGEKNQPAPASGAEITTGNTTQIQVIAAPGNTEQMVVLADIINREYQESQASEQIPENQETLRKIAHEYAASQNIQLTGKQLRKLDRYAAKMDKKQQRGANDVNWGPANNLEWFILLGAAAGLVVGIFGIGFGWFVFLGLALVYLYFKLLKNN